MVSKCANPNCSTPFLYLGKGTLFFFEISPDSEPPVATESLRTLRKGPHRIETFWLCRNCSSRLVVRMIRGKVEVVSRENALVLARQGVGFFGEEPRIPELNSNEG